MSGPYPDYNNPNEPNYCKFYVQQPRTVFVELRVNGGLVAGRRLQRRHEAWAEDSITLTGNVKMWMTPGSTIQVWVVPTVNPGEDSRKLAKTYNVILTGTSLTVQKLRHFG